MSSGKTLPQVHIIPSFPPHKSGFPSSRKGGGNYVNFQILVKFSPPRLILDILALFDFAALSNYKSFNTVLCLEVFHPQFALYLLIYTLFSSYNVYA